MKQEEDNKKRNDKEDDGSFLSKVMDFFIKLMDKFTDGKYSTKEEQDFFADEKNLYDEKGDITPEYQRRFVEFEEMIRNKNVDEFLHEIHSTDSEEFGPAYNETEMTILKSALDYVTSQQQIVYEIIEAKKSAMRKKIPFDFDFFIKKRVEQEGCDVEEAIENLREYVKEHIEEIANECPELIEYLNLQIDVKIDVLRLVSAATESAMHNDISFDFDEYLKKMVKQDGRDFENTKEKIRQYVIEHIEDIKEGCPELAEYLGVPMDVTNSNNEREEENGYGNH